MESLTCYLEDGGPAFSEDIEFPVELLARSKNLVKDWDAKLLPDLYKNMPSFDRETVDNMEFVETNLPDRIGISLLDNSSLGASSDKMTDNMVLSTSMVNSDPLIWEGFASTLSAISAEPHSKKQLTVDRKLEKWTDSIQADRILNSEENLVSSLVKDSLPAKRARTTNLHPHNSLCQVHGCYKDLNSSKDYHKRHRVCDVHSKSAKVIVNGIEKRFCQQCSRFHLLTEFDEGKRSCRKRLAGHNERRRKPQLGAHLSSEFLEMTLLKRTSFLSPETFPAGFFYKERFDNDNHSRNIKFIQLPIDNSQVAVSVEHGQPRKSLADPHTKLQPSQTCIDTDSGGALSLLSAQSQNTSSASADLSMVLPPVNGVRHHAYIGMDQNFSKNLENSTLKRFAINGYSSGTIDQERIPRYHDGNLAFGFKVPMEGTFQNSKCKHPNSCLSPEVGIIDLLQLSSHLQRVEQQRKSLLVKQEDETMTFCCSSTM